MADEIHARLSAIHKEIYALEEFIKDKYSYFLSRAFTTNGSNPNTKPSNSIFRMIYDHGPGPLNREGMVPRIDFDGVEHIHVAISGPKATEFLSVSICIERVWELAKRPPFYFQKGLYSDLLKHIEALPHVKESLNMMSEAYDNGNKDDYKIAYDMFKDACIDSYLVHVGLGSSSFIKSASKE